MNTKLNSLNEKQRKLWAIIREALNYEDTDEDFNEFKEEASMKRICRVNCINLGEMPQHTLPYVIDLTLERR